MDEWKKEDTQSLPRRNRAEGNKRVVSEAVGNPFIVALACRFTEAVMMIVFGMVIGDKFCGIAFASTRNQVLFRGAFFILKNLPRYLRRNL